MKKTLALLLLALLVLPVPLAIASSSGKATGTASLIANIGDHSVIDYNITGTSSESTNATFSLNLNLEAQQKTQATLSGDVSLTYNNPDLPEASIDYVVTFNAGNHEFHEHQEGSLYINLTSFLQGYLYGQQQTPPTVTGTPNPTPTTPPGPPGSQPGGISITALYIDFASDGNGHYNDTYAELTSHTTASFTLVGGASIVGLPGNATGNILLDNHVIVNNTESTSHYKLVIAFNSGIAQVDAGLAALVYQYLKMIANSTEAGGTEITNVTSNGTAVTVEGITHGYVNNLFVPTPFSGASGAAPGMGLGKIGTNMTIINETGIPLFFENGTANGHYEIHATSENGKLVLNGNINIQVTGINPDALPFYPTKVNVKINGADKDFTAKIHVEGDGDAATAFEIAKALGLATKDALNCETSTASISINSDGSVHFYNMETGEDLGTTLQLSCQDLGVLKHIIAAPPNTTVKQEGEGKLVLSFKGTGTHHGKVSFATIANAKVVIVQGNGIVVSTGKIALSTPKTLVVKASNNLIVHVKVHASSQINGSLEVIALNKTQADKEAKTHGYTAAGAGVTINGIEKGAATINLPAEKTNGIAILEISHNGEVKLITNYKVEANGTITFNATSFSTFIVVNAAPSQTTTQPGGQTTTSPSHTTSKTTTSHPPTSGSGTKTKTSTGTGTSTTSGGHSQTSPSQTSGSPAKTKQSKSGGVSGATIAAGIVIVILILAAAFYAMKK